MSEVRVRFAQYKIPPMSEVSSIY